MPVLHSPGRGVWAGGCDDGGGGGDAGVCGLRRVRRQDPSPAGRLGMPRPGARRPTPAAAMIRRRTPPAPAST